eukprot:54770-Eustigmatos_ZCMA.PRE.1
MAPGFYHSCCRSGEFLVNERGSVHQSYPKTVHRGCLKKGYELRFLCVSTQKCSVQPLPRANMASSRAAQCSCTLTSTLKELARPPQYTCILYTSEPA